MYWKIHTPNLLKEIANNSRDAQGISRPLEILGKILFALADRARELDDEELNSLCCRLTLFTAADPSSEDYSQAASDLVSKYDEKLIERISKK